MAPEPMSSILPSPALPQFMSSTLPNPALPRRLLSVLIAALFGFTLALTPVSAPPAKAAGITAGVGVRALHITAGQAGVPYKWGGTTRAGFDCSGLTQYAYARAGKRLPRTTQQQYNASIHIRAKIRRPGDLVFFNKGRVIYHMAVYAGNGYIWHAPRSGKRVSKVRLWTTRVLYGRVR